MKHVSFLILISNREHKASLILQKAILSFWNFRRLLYQPVFLLLSRFHLSQICLSSGKEACPQVISASQGMNS